MAVLLVQKVRRFDVPDGLVGTIPNLRGKHMANSPHAAKTNPNFAAAVLLLTLGYYLTAFFPYELALPEYAENGARWLPDGSLSFKTAGIALEIRNRESGPNLRGSKTTRILLGVYSFGPNQTGPARIASFSSSPLLRNLTIAQSRSDLVVRVRRPESDLNGMPDLVVPGVFAIPGWHWIETRVLIDSIEVAVDGVTRITTSNDLSGIASWDWSYPWVFGNERTGDRPWRGKIRTAELCMDTDCIDFVHPDMLGIPGGYWIGDWRTLIDMKGLVSSSPFDVAINLLGFIPFGILLARLRKPTVSLRAVVISTSALSLSIEIGQIFFQGRFTSIVDIICNVAGALLGYVVSRRVIENDAFC